jgi:hypothetical protein
MVQCEKRMPHRTNPWSHALVDRNSRSTLRSKRRRTMRTILILASAALTSAAFIGPAAADDHLHLTPPLYREQARPAQQIRAIHDLTTTPQPVAAPATVSRTVSALGRPMVQASVEASR